MTIANVNIKKVLLRRGNTTQNDNYRGVYGEISVDMEAKTLRIHDGAVTGGYTVSSGGGGGGSGPDTVLRANVGAYQIYANANAAAQATGINTINANIGAYQIWANANAANQHSQIFTNYSFFLSNVGAAHSEINGLRANITAANIAWTANAATQATAINSIDANLGSFQTYANATFTGGSNYSNTNVAAYLTGSISTGNIIPRSNVTYTLGNVTHWWKELYVGSNTIYIAGVPLSIDANQNLLINGNIVQGGNVDAVNANVAVIDANIGAYQRWANVNAASQSTSINVTNANIGAYQIWANANAAAQTTAINLINANVAAANTAIGSVTTAWTANAGTQATDINALRANITAANTAISAVTTAWTANAGTQATEINSLRANVTAANSAIATLQTQTYSNVNTAAYLAGAITAGNVTAGNLTVEYNAVVLGNLRVAGTQTTVNASTLNITDLWVTVADGAVQASDANGAGLRIDGALANIAYSSITDSFDFNKPITVGTLTTSTTLRTATINNTGSGRITIDPDGDSFTYIRVDGWDDGSERLVISNQRADAAGIYFYTQNGESFRMSDGQFKFADDTWQTTAWTGTVANLTLGANVVALSADGNLTLPSNMIFASSPAMSGTGIIFGDGSYQNTAWTGNVARLTNNGNEVVLGSDGALTIVNAINTQPGQYLFLGSDTSTEMSWSNSVQAPNTRVYSGIGSGPDGFGIQNATTDGEGSWVSKGWTFDFDGKLTLPSVSEINTKNNNGLVNQRIQMGGDDSYLYLANYTGPVLGQSFTDADWATAVWDGTSLTITDCAGFVTYINTINTAPVLRINGSTWSETTGRQSSGDEVTFSNLPISTPTPVTVTQLDVYTRTQASLALEGDTVAIYTPNDTYWVFDGAGNLTLPENGNINFANGVNILSTVSSGGSTGDLIISGNIITSNDGNTFVNFDSDNELVIGTNTSSNVKIFVDDSNGGDLKTWTFGTDGSLTVPKFGTINFVDPVIGGFGTPNTTTRTPGNRIVLYPSFNGSGLVDYAIGIDGDVQWYSIPDSNATFEWYAGNNKVLSLSGDGNLTLPAGGDILDSNGDSVLGGINVSLPGLATSGTGTSDVAGNQVYALAINTESESDDEIALKVYAGGNNAGPAIAIGQDIGGSHRANVVAIGNFDVGYNSLPGGVYIGYGAGFNDTEQPQGLHSIAIGSKAAWNFATNNSITINATGNQLNPDESGLFIKPIREEQYDDAILYYNTTSGEVTYAANPGVGATVSNTAPTAVNGRLWYNTEDGRMYVRGLDTWIDASPAVVPGNMVGYDLDGNITLRDDARINYANGTSIINSVYGDAEVAEFLSAYTGNIAKIGANPLNISAASVKLRSDNETWTFNSAGDIVFPDGTRQNTASNLSMLVGNIAKPGAGDGYEFSANVAGIDAGAGEVYVELDQDLFGGPTEGLITIAGVAGMTEANGTWGYVAVEARFIQLYTTYPLTTPVTGAGWGTYTSGGTAVSFGANPLTISADSITLRTVNNNNYLFDNYGIRFPDDTVQTTAYTGGAGGAGNALVNGAYRVALQANGVLTIGANATISNDGEFRLWATDTDITVYRNGQDGYGVKAGNIETYTDNALRTVVNSNGLEIRTGGISFASSTAIISNVDVITVLDHIRSPSYQFANGVSILSNLAASTGNITFDGSDIIGTGTNVTITADTTDWTFYSNGSTVFPDHGAVSITGNLTVGNLTVTGNSTIINTESYTVVDNIIQMATDNPADTLDLGFVAHRTVDSTLQHTGLVRDSSEGIWKLFSNVLVQPGSTVDFTDAVYDTLAVGGLSAGNTFIYSVNFTGSPLASSSPGIQWNDGFQDGIYGDTQVAAYLSTNTATVANLRVLNTYAPVEATGNVGDLHGQIRIDSNYLYVTSGAYGQQSYTVKAFADHIFGTQYFIALAKGTYPKPENGWEITRDGWGMYFSLDLDPVDFGTYWWCSVAGYSGSFPAWSAGDNVTLRGTTSTVWKSIPLSTIRTPAYSNSNVEAYIGANVGAYQTWANATFSTGGGSTYSNANVVANLQNFVTAISTTANITTTANVIAPNYLFANGVNILSTVSAGSTYSNANVIAMYSANTYVGFGNVGTAYTTQANVTQMFVGNTTTIGAGSSGLGSTVILNNAYFGANGAMYARNTQTGAAQYRISGGTFDWSGTTGAVTANSVQSFALWAQLNGTSLTTFNGIGITSAGTVAVNASGGITTTQTTFPLVNATATTVQFGGAATTITAGATTVNVQVGGSSMRGNISVGNILVGGNISAGNIAVGSNISAGNIAVGSNISASSIALTSAITAATATVTANVTALNFVTTGTFGNITGANVISANSVSVTTFVRTAAVTFEALPNAAAAGAGARAFITNGNTATFGSQVSGGGGNAVPVYSNGTNWYVG